MLSLSSTRSQVASDAPEEHLCFNIYDSAGRVIFTRILGSLAKIKQKMLFRFHQDGLVEICQRPDVSNRVAHIWLTANKEIFGFEDFNWSHQGSSLVLEIPVRSLLSVLSACEGVENLIFEVKRLGISTGTKPLDFLFISSAPEMVTFSSTVHQLPVAIISESQGEGLFQEPLIPDPSISFQLPAPIALKDRLARLSKQASTITLSANYRRQFFCKVFGDFFQTDFANDQLQVMRPSGTIIEDEHKLHDIMVRADDLIRSISCIAANHTPVMCAIIAGQSLIFSTKLPSPLGTDYQAGSFTLILGAYHVE